MQRLMLTTLSVIFCSSVLKAQLKSIPGNYFQWPVEAKAGIAANFGELRSNHWHMGLDVRTNQRENLPVYAAASGYIIRISVEPFGYGKAIYIAHPNGLTTVYGHLNKFYPALDNYIIAEQNKQQSWPIALDFDSKQFPVSKGQFIAWSGNTGGSQGPHVHFEVRDSKSNRCLNPFFFTFPIPDAVAPEFSKLAIYNRNLSVFDQSPVQITVKKDKKGTWVFPKNNLIKTGSSSVSFAIGAIDRVSGANNPNGIYGARIFFDNKPLIEFAFDSMDYNETDYINAHIDYKLKHNGGPYLQHLSQLPGDHGLTYHNQNTNGVIALADTAVHQVKIEIFDIKKNTSTLNFKVQFDSKLAQSIKPSQGPFFFPNQVNIFEQPEFNVMIDEYGIYDTMKIIYSKTESAERNAVSAAFRFGDPSLPVHNRITVRIKPSVNIPAAFREKLVIRRSDGRSGSYRKAIWQKEMLMASFPTFGTYQVFLDTTAPFINDPGGKGDTADLSGLKSIIFTPGDNTGIKSFRAELNGKWLMFTNDKGRRHIYNFDEQCPYGVHQLKVRIEDIAGNITEKEWWFKRSAFVPKKKLVPGKKPPLRKKTTKKK